MTHPRRTVRYPVGVAHLGLGAFHRAHQAWYTQHAADGVGIAAFTVRSPGAAQTLADQDALYTLVERGPEGDHLTLMQVLSEVHDGADAVSWRRTLSNPEVTVLTLTVTEAGYRENSIVPNRVLDGLRARFEANAMPLAVVSCDNLPHNGTVIRDAVLRSADRGGTSGADDFLTWLGSSVEFVSTMVDRITPSTTSADVENIARQSGWRDEAPVVTEPFTEWVLDGSFPAGRPQWEAAGARFIPDVSPYERRKLWLLNAGHSLLAYHGLARGYETIAQCMADNALTTELERLWDEHAVVLPFDEWQIDDVRATLRSRFVNARIEHRLSQIGTDGSQKLRPRILDPLCERLRVGVGPGQAQIGVLVAWIRYLERDDVRDVAAHDLIRGLNAVSAPRDRARLVLDQLAPDRTDDLVPLLAESLSTSRPFL